MNDLPENDVILAVRRLYKENPFAQQLFDLNAERERDANKTSLDVISRKLDISRGEAVALARSLEETGCGSFKVGRRGSASRFEWDYSCIALGKAAAGETIQLEKAENPQEEEEDPEPSPGAANGLTISEAKAALAKRLGISIESIEIHIKA
jgi:hypothetical protein